MSTPTLQDRAAAAATALERLARQLASDPVDDPITAAYVRRLLYAAATVEDRTEADRRRVEPDPFYLGPLRLDPQTTASRYG